MSIHRNLSFLIFAAVSAVTIMISSNLLAAETTIIGEVDDQYQVTDTDGEIYTLVKNDVGRKIITEHISEIVEITGTVEYSEKDDTLVITAKRFEVMNSDDSDEADDTDVADYEDEADYDDEADEADYDEEEYEE